MDTNQSELRTEGHRLSNNIYFICANMLNQCIRSGYHCEGRKDILTIYKDIKGTGRRYKVNYSYNDIFSKEFGLIDFVDREHNDPYYQYMIMGPMTVEEKVIYFINNAKIPGQKSTE